MKSRLLKSFIFVFVCLGMAHAAMAQTKIATVNLKEVYERYWKSKQAFAQYTNRASELDVQRREILADYPKLNEDYRKLLETADDPAIAESERAQRKQAAQAKLREVQAVEEKLKNFDVSARTELEKQRRAMIDSILMDIQEATKTRATAAGYDIVWDASFRSPDGSPLILFSNPQKDLSEEVIGLLNKNAPAVSTPPAKSKK